MRVALGNRNLTVRDVHASRSQPHRFRAERQLTAVRISEIGMMAGRARNVLVPRQDGIPEEQPAQLDHRGVRLTLFEGWSLGCHVSRQKPGDGDRDERKRA